MKTVLIIKSVGFQQLDRVVQKINQNIELPQKVFILTHEHGKDIASKYFGAQQVLIYTYKRNFNCLFLPPLLKQMTFDEIILPVTNLSGKGFTNVFLFSLRIRSIYRRILNINLDESPITKKHIFGLFFSQILYSVISVVLTAIFGVLLFIVWLLL
ncbi:MAG: hypothetical protein L3V56_00250 [Candidatus Magnetoovum sp. WYHC-5]|nr:hypothetical protein [Candidatus Magnetoovum sp. WYHC-5]